MQPNDETEIALVRAEAGTDPGASADSIRSSIAYAVAALRIVDGRIVGADAELSA
jgi:2-keto-4-pentenoate hydratase